MNEKVRLAVDYLYENDLVIKKIIDEIGPCTLSPSNDYFASLVKSIIFQQLSNQAAKSIYRKFLKELKFKLNPKAVLNLKDNQFRKAGISIQKKSYLLDLSEKMKHETIDITRIPDAADEELIEILTELKGIGRWSAQMFLIFCLIRLDVLPLDDVGFRKAIQINYGFNELPSKKEIANISKKWGSYRSIAAWYLWQSINKKKMNS